MKTNNKKKTTTKKPAPKPKHMKKGEKLQPKLNTFQIQVLQSQVIDWMLDGIGRSEIIKKIHVNLPTGIEVSDVWATHFIQSCKQTIEQDTAEETMNIIHTHINLYETIFAYFHKIKFAPGENKAMYQKEKLLGLHRSDVTIKINNRQNINIRPEPVYNIGKLNSKEQSRLQILLKKASTS